MSQRPRLPAIAEDDDCDQDSTDSDRSQPAPLPQGHGSARRAGAGPGHGAHGHHAHGHAHSTASSGGGGGDSADEQSSSGSSSSVDARASRAPSPSSASPAAPASAALADVVVYAPDGKTVRGAPFDRLVRWLVLEQPDPQRLRPFLYSYRLHASAAHLWQVLMQLSAEQGAARRAVGQAVREWAGRPALYELDFRRRALGTQLLNFASSGALSVAEANQLKLLCVQRDRPSPSASPAPSPSASPAPSPSRKASRSPPVPSAAPPSPALAAAGRRRSIEGPPPPVSAATPLAPGPAGLPSSVLAAFKTEALVAALTQLDVEAVAQVRVPEFLGQAWQKESRDRLAPGLTALAAHFNHVSFWLATDILAAGAGPALAKRLKKGIKLAHRCAALRNFQGAMALASGLNHSSVQRLKKAWAALEPRVRALFDQVDELFVPQGNFRHYRDHLRAASAAKTPAGHAAPVLPYVALILRDVTFINDGNPDYLPAPPASAPVQAPAPGPPEPPPPIINLDKLELLGAQIMLFCSLRQAPFSALGADPAVMQAVQQARVLDEEALHARSAECEPRRLATVPAADSSVALEELLKRAPAQWSVEEVAVWVGAVLAPHYQDLVRAGTLDGARLLALDQAALLELGVHKLGHRKRLLKHIQMLRDGRAQASISPAEDSASDSEAPLGRDRPAGDARPPAADSPLFWSEADVAAWLEAIGEGACRGALARTSGLALLDLTTSEKLAALGVDKLGTRKRLLRAIDVLRAGLGPAVRGGSGEDEGGGVLEWGVEDVGRWLEGAELGEYRKAFTENQVRGADLLELGEADLTRLGVTKLGHRKRLLKLLEELRAQRLQDDLPPPATESDERNEDSMDCVVVKCYLDDDIRVFRHIPKSASLRKLRRAIEKEYKCPMKLQHKLGESGTLHPIETDAELGDALASVAVLKLYLVRA